jgi:hypothetical protein
MTSQRKTVEQMLRNWKGEDSEQPLSTETLAERIDQEYERYIATLPGQTAAIKAGQQSNERRVA